MKTFARRLLAVVLLVPNALNAPVVLGGYGTGYGKNVSAVEVAQLPRFCWAQMDVPDAKGPGYSFPQECGPGMNHYCPGLVDLIRAKSAGSKAKAVPLLRKAEGMIRYTEDWMKDYPSCPIRSHVESSKAEVRNLLTLYGVKPEGAK